MLHLTQIWNLRISYPNEELYFFDDDVKGAFHHLKYHSDVAGAFAFSISSYLMISMGQTFGYVDSPQDWEPFAIACTHLARNLSHYPGLLAKHNFVIDQVEFSEPPTKDISFTPVSSDKYYQSVVDKFRTFYNMFVDNFLFVTVEPSIRHAITASIEVLYIVLGFPDIVAY